MYMNSKNNSSYKVMLIDDTEVDSFISKRILTSTQFSNEITEFNSAQKALDYLVENAHLPHALPQVIFIDIHMPAMDGFDFIEKFNMLPPIVLKYCKLIMLSASADSVDHEKIKSYRSILKFLPKPLTKNELQALNMELSETNK